MVFASGDTDIHIQAMGVLLALQVHGPLWSLFPLELLAPRPPCAQSPSPMKTVTNGVWEGKSKVLLACVRDSPVTPQAVIPSWSLRSSGDSLSYGFEILHVPQWNWGSPVTATGATGSLPSSEELRESYTSLIYGRLDSFSSAMQVRQNKLSPNCIPTE